MEINKIHELCKCARHIGNMLYCPCIYFQNTVYVYCMFTGWGEISTKIFHRHHVTKGPVMIRVQVLIQIQGIYQYCLMHKEIALLQTGDFCNV